MTRIHYSVIFKENICITAHKDVTQVSHCPGQVMDIFMGSKVKIYNLPGGRFSINKELQIFLWSPHGDSFDLLVRSLWHLAFVVLNMVLFIPDQWSS